jgi:hypothetical protein
MMISCGQTLRAVCGLRVKGESGRWGCRPLGAWVNSWGAMSAKLSRPVRGAGHTQEDGHGKYQNANYSDNWHPWSLLIAPTMGSFCLQGLSASMEQQLHSHRYSCTARPSAADGALTRLNPISQPISDVNSHPPIRRLSEANAL